MVPKLFRIRPKVAENAPEDKVVVVMNKVQADKHGIELDELGIPTLSSLEAWHKKNNPHLFEAEEEES